MLAAGAHALLRGRGAHVLAALLAEEDVLELHHAGVREEEGRVLGGHQGRRADDGVPVLPEVLEKLLPESAAADHVCARRGTRPPADTSLQESIAQAMPVLEVTVVGEELRRRQDGLLYAVAVGVAGVGPRQLLLTARRTMPGIPRGGAGAGRAWRKALGRPVGAGRKPPARLQRPVESGDSPKAGLDPRWRRCPSAMPRGRQLLAEPAAPDSPRRRAPLRPAAREGVVVQVSGAGAEIGDDRLG